MAPLQQIWLQVRQWGWPMGSKLARRGLHIPQSSIQSVCQPRLQSRPAWKRSRLAPWSLMVSRTAEALRGERTAPPSIDDTRTTLVGWIVLRRDCLRARMFEVSRPEAPTAFVYHCDHARFECIDSP